MTYPPQQPQDSTAGQDWQQPQQYGPPPGQQWHRQAPRSPRRVLIWALLGAVVAAALIVGAILIFTGDDIRSDLSARDQELCEVVLDDDQAIGYLSEQVDELIQNGGNFSSEGDAYAFTEVPVRRSENELNSRIANYDEPNSAGYIDDAELLDRAKALRDVLFNLRLASDDGSPMDPDTLNSARAAIDDIAASCTS